MFGRTKRIIFSHIQELLQIKIRSSPSVLVLWELYDNSQAHVRSLKVLKISGRQYVAVLTPLILSRLPPDLGMEWARDGEGHQSDLEFLLDFLETEITRRERSQTFSREDNAVNTDDTTDKLFSAASLYSSGGKLSRYCELCECDGHSIDRCFSITKASIGNRRSILRRVGACFRCLTTAKMHTYRNCTFKC